MAESAPTVEFKVTVYTDPKYRPLVKDHIRMMLSEQFDTRCDIEDM